MRGHIEKKPKSPLVGRDVPGTIVDVHGKRYSFNTEDFDSKQLPYKPQEGAPVLFVVDPDEPESVMYLRDLYC
jgi:hypothetical protein